VNPQVAPTKIASEAESPGPGRRQHELSKSDRNDSSLRRGGSEAMISRGIHRVDPLAGTVWTFHEGLKLDALVKSPDRTNQGIDTGDLA